MPETQQHYDVNNYSDLIVGTLQTNIIDKLDGLKKSGSISDDVYDLVVRNVSYCAIEVIPLIKANNDALEVLYQTAVGP